ncbi:hypothetical protein G2912_33115 [Paraburkholderia aspalathi]|nr:hypothetical protein [Paraburkholderia aspalathi]MBK3815195.1 hypothetical protein [Paraburkholderia aspalathi]
MDTAGKSLRSMVEKWLAPDPQAAIRVIQFRRTCPNQRRYVRVEILRTAGAVGIFFFRHDDGTWCVFPQDTVRPAMNVYPCAA